MRETYSLSTETIKVLKGHESAIADEWNKSAQYVYAILAGTEPDRFARFLGLYAAAVRAGAPVCHWDDKFAAVRARYEKQHARRQTVAECLTEKIGRDAETTARLVDALRDGRVDEDEALRLHALIRLEREVLDELEKVIGGHDGGDHHDRHPF